MIVFEGKSATRAMGVSVFRHASDSVVGVFQFSDMPATASLGCFSFKTCQRQRRWGVSVLKHASDTVVGVFQF